MCLRSTGRRPGQTFQAEDKLSGRAPVGVPVPFRGSVEWRKRSLLFMTAAPQLTIAVIGQP